MSDCISRQAAIDGKISIQCANGVEIYSDEAVPIEYLKALPSAQPEIIQCKDCKYRDYWGSCKKLNCVFNGHKTVTFDNNFYCGFAERSET